MSKLPSGKVRYLLYIGKDPSGKKRYKSFTADSMRDAKKQARAWEALHPNTGPQISLADACERFLEGRSSTLAPDTWNDYQNRIRTLNRWYPDFFKMPLAGLTTERMQWFANSLASRNCEKKPDKPMSPNTVYKYYSLIGTVLKTYGIQFNNIQLPPKQKPQLTIPENDQVKELILSVAGTQLEIPILLAALGPMRRSEICALTMDDIDFENNIIKVSKGKVLNGNHQYVIKQWPKTSAGNRDIQYPPEVIQKIKDQGYITNCNPGTISRNYIRHLERHNLTKFRFHDLRHYSASFLLAIKIPPVYVMERGGWESESTMKRYIHALDKQRKEYAQQASNAFQDLL